MIPFISGESSAALASLGDGFPLRQPDLSTDNIFADDDLNITCIIDWAFASTVPISTALMTPGLPSPRDDTDSFPNSAFRSGLIDHHFHGKDTDLASDIWENARRAWLFTRLTILDGSQDYYYFRELYMSVYKPGEISISSLFQTAQKEDHLIELARELADDEEWAPEIAKQEEDYFAAIGQIDRLMGDEREIKLIGIERQAIARKLTVVSELSQDFVADGRLWRWIEEGVRDLASVDDVTDTS